MALVLNATPGDAAANAFVTLAEANTSMDARLNAAAWTAATDDTKNRGIVEATRELSSKNWIGGRVTTTQALAWPRQWATNPDAPPFAVQWFDIAIIPPRIKDATIELAFQFVKAGSTDVAALPSTDGVTEKTIDVITTRYAEPFAQKTGLQRYPRVWDLIRPLMVSAGATFEIVRG